MRITQAMFVWPLIIIVSLAVLLLVAGQLGWLQGTPPKDPGVRDGRLQPPSVHPNSVSSQASLYPGHPQHQGADIAPLALRGDGPATLARINEIIAGMQGARVVRDDGDYLYVQFTTPVLKFVDDAEFWFDPVNKVIQLRSASRLGRRDFDVNRKRIETIRSALAAEK